MNKILFLILGIIFLPSIAHAEWWDPRTWFTQNEVKNVLEFKTEIKDQGANINKDNKSSETVVATSSVAVPEPKIIERTVTKTVTVPVDRIVEKILIKPDQSVIDENNSLKLKIKDLQATSTQCAVDLEKLQARIKQLEAPMTQAEAQRKATLTAIANIDLEIAKTRSGYYDKELCASGSLYSYTCNEVRTGNPTYGATENTRSLKIGQLEVQKAKLQVELSNL